MKNFFQNIKKRYLNLPIQAKLTISHLIILSIPVIIVGIFFVFRMYDMVVSETISREQNKTLSVAPTIEKEVDKILQFEKQLKDSTYFEKLTTSKRTESLRTLSFSEDAKEFSNLIEDMQSSTLIKKVKLYINEPPREKDYIVGPLYDNLTLAAEARGSYWHGIFSGTPTTTSLMCPPFYLSSLEKEHYGNAAYITKFTIKQDGVSYQGFLALYFSQDFFDELLKTSLASEDNSAYLINSRDSVVASSQSSGAGAYYFNYDEINEYFTSSNNFIPKTVAGKEVYAAFYNVKGVDWYLVIALPAGPMLTHSYQLVLGMFLIYLFFVLIVFWFANRLSHSLTSRITAVSEEMKRAKSNLPVALPPPTAIDEVGVMIDSYNHMTETINNLMESQMKTAEELRIAEFNSLQAQINPHFLYNTMEMINWLAQQGKQEDVSQAIIKLSRYYKLTLSKKKSFSTLSEELEHVTTYVELQNMRFHDTIELVIDVPEELLDYTIPKLTLQPVIENAVLHGILEKECKTGTLVITAWREEEEIIILVSDDGVGMDEETLKEIYSQDKAGPSKGSNIAVYNTHRRLQILYGETSGLVYRSEIGVGTEVEIHIATSGEETN
ncbi:two-component system sensor histidine kinase YesM [Lachnospiraceae bacterium PF1-21]|uniref:sensor histidine kinase n=1 Tax=Ohessyouella blattaphilus TaxID=2949333 RepID=UPI003E1D1D83